MHCMERINERTQSLMTKWLPDNLSANETKACAYPHQGHGPRADKEAGYISASSAIPHVFSCEMQPVHTLGHFRRCAGEPKWSCVVQPSEVRSADRYFVALEAHSKERAPR